MRLEEYSQRLKSDSPTIDFSAKHGKMIVCRKQTNEIENHLETAKELLQVMIEAKDVPTIEAIHRLRDLATVLDQLKLQDECLVVGNCAMQLAQALGLRAVEFQKVAAQIIFRITRLDVYKSRMCPLFIQAISTCVPQVTAMSYDQPVQQTSYDPEIIYIVNSPLFKDWNQYHSQFFCFENEYEAAVVFFLEGLPDVVPQPTSDLHSCMSSPILIRCHRYHIIVLESNY